MPPALAQTTAQQGFLPLGPGLFRLTFDIGPGWNGGYWDGPPDLEDDGLENFFQQLVAGITRLPGDLVRPRWQPEEPNLPDFGTNWAAVGVVDDTLDAGWAAWIHDSENGGRDYLSQHETLTLLCTFYGPNADRYDGLLRDGLQVGQNREVLQLTAMGLVDIGPRTRVPELIKMRWTQRNDRRIRFHRQILRCYPVLNLLGATAVLGVQSGNLPPLTETTSVSE